MTETEEEKEQEQEKEQEAVSGMRANGLTPGTPHVTSLRGFVHPHL